MRDLKKHARMSFQRRSRLHESEKRVHLKSLKNSRVHVFPNCTKGLQEKNAQKQIHDHLHEAQHKNITIFNCQNSKLCSKHLLLGRTELKL